MSLRAHDITITRGGLRVLEGVSFDLTAGRALVLRGPNGIGKTTLLRTVAGLQPPTLGTIERDRDAVAYSGHADGIKAMLSVHENLRFWARIFGTNRSTVDAALDGFGLTDLAERPAGMLSAGQKRRLGLARLLVTGRPVWVLDEPTVSLDTAAIGMFAEVIRTHLSGGGMALMATHIALGLPEADDLDLTPFRAALPSPDAFDEAFL